MINQLHENFVAALQPSWNRWLRERHGDSNNLWFDDACIACEADRNPPLKFALDACLPPRKKRHLVTYHRQITALLQTLAKKNLILYDGYGGNYFKLPDL